MKTDNTQSYRQIILSVVKMNGDFTQDEVDYYRHKAANYSLASMVYVLHSSNGRSGSLQFVDFYVINKLNFRQYIKHCIRKLITTALGNFGICRTFIVV